MAANRDASIVGVIIPHYYLFPEALLLTAPTILYLPDYFPHLMPGTIFDKSAEKDRENKEVGLALAKRASAILTNSRFTANYLPDAGFVAPGEGNKIVVAPLPLLGAGRTEELSWQDAWTLRHKIAGRRVIFYPTANRPNKQLAFMLQLFALIRMEHPDLLLVLTCNLGAVPAVARAADRFELNENLITMPSIDESSLRWLYENAAVLCLTSTSEGNFPPQVLEALVYGTPVVATRLPTITELLGDRADDLLLCSPLDLGDFRLKLSQALTDRNTVLGKQAEVLERLRRTNSREQFYRKLEEIVSPLSARKQAA